MGTAAGWALARQGHSVIVLEQFQHIHKMGSHGGHTRIFRHAYFEGPAYVPWTIEADNAWVALQERTGIDLMVRCGCLDMSAPGLDHARNAGHSAALYNLPHEMMTGDEVNKRFPAWSIPSDWEACLDPEAGILLIEPTLRALVTEFREAGGVLVENMKVEGWDETPDGVTVRTSNGIYEADRLIVTAGAWAGKLLGGLDLPLEVCRKPVMWFDTAGHPDFGTDRFPGFIADTGPDEFYGLPAYGSDGLKIGIHNDRNVVDPDDFKRDVSPEDLTANLRDFLATSLKGVRPELAATSMCMYTMTPDEDFIIDRHPSQERVTFAAGFSGHGYKFAPVVGELLADLATDAAAETPAHFALTRFATV
jgi:monomeric sarcosine oxidase